MSYLVYNTEHLTMTDITAEISTDYDLDLSADSIDQEFGQDLMQLNLELADIAMFDTEVNQLLNSGVAVENFGINRSSFSVLKTTELLNGTALESMGVESFGDHQPGDPESEMALEALMEKAKDVATAWAAKIVTFAKNMSDKLLGGLTTMWNQIAEQSKTLSAKAWDKTKAAGAAVQAHPYKTVFAALGAAVAVAGVFALVASGMPGAYANESALKSFMYKISDMIGKIQWPFGQLKTSLSPDGAKIICNISAGEKMAKAAASADKLGWSATAVKAVSGQVGKIWSSLKGGIAAVGTHAVNASKAVGKFGGNEMGDKVKDKVTGKTGSGLAGWASGEVVKKMYNTALWSIVGALYVLCRDIVIKAFRVVKDTFNSLRPAAA
jgi:ElaB/YqjD/DUF883 family membrane-anchored ribosome-binding protein